MKLKVETLTSCSPFDRAGTDHLFEVRAGIGVDYALSKAACLAESIASVTEDGAQNEFDASTAYLLAFAARAIQGLINSVEASTADMDPAA